MQESPCYRIWKNPHPSLGQKIYNKQFTLSTKWIIIRMTICQQEDVAKHLGAKNMHIRHGNKEHVNTHILEFCLDINVQTKKVIHTKNEDATNWRSSICYRISTSTSNTQPGAAIKRLDIVSFMPAIYINICHNKIWITSKHNIGEKCSSPPAKNTYIDAFKRSDS